MKVWILTGYDWDDPVDDWVVGVFATRQAAQNQILKMLDHAYYKIDEYEVQL